MNENVYQPNEGESGNLNLDEPGRLPDVQSLLVDNHHYLAPWIIRAWFLWLDCLERDSQWWCMQ